MIVKLIFLFFEKYLRSVSWFGGDNLRNHIPKLKSHLSWLRQVTPRLIYQCYGKQQTKNP